MKVLIEYEDAISAKHTDKTVDSFHNAVGPSYIFHATDNFQKWQKWILSVILIAQIFGTMPVCGILSKDTRHVRFNWISVRLVVSLIFTMFAIMEVAMVMLKATDENIDLGMAGPLLCHCFYS